MTTKKEKKVKETEIVETPSTDMTEITSKADLKAFLSTVRDDLLKEESTPIYAMAAMKHVLTHEGVYEFMDTASKEILQEIWVKLSQSGFQLRKPPMLFGDADSTVK